MKRLPRPPRRPSWRRAILAIPASAGAMLLIAGRAASQERAYSLDFEGPRAVFGEPGSPVRGTWFATLFGNDGAGATSAEAWQLGLTVQGGRIAGFGLEGTAAERALGGGFVHNEILTWLGFDAAVSTVVLPAGVSLRPRVTHRIAAIDIEATVPPGRPGTVSLAHDDRIEGPGPRVRLWVRDRGRELFPFLGAFSFEVQAPPVRALGFAIENIMSDVPFDSIVGGRDAAGEVEVLVDQEDTGSLHVFPAIVSWAQSTDLGIQGWSLSILIEGEAVCVDATERGTATSKMDGAFTLTQCIDRLRNEGRHGAVATMVCSFGDNCRLPPVGTFAVADITIAADRPQGADDKLARLRFEDGLRGRSTPVDNVLTVAGSSAEICNLDDASLTVRFRLRRFIRGDANYDQRVNVSDPVTILRNQFRGDAPIRCADAADCNDDGKVDIADAIFSFGYLFRGFRQPPAPFPAPGRDPTPDVLRCQPQDQSPTGG